MVYADYAYYTDTFLGNAIEEANFPPLALRASLFLDYCTMGRAARRAELDAVRMACCAVAEVYLAIDTAQKLAAQSLAAGVSSVTSEDGNGELQSESVGSWSQSYRSGGSSAADALKASASAQEQLLATVRIYLGGTGLLRARGYMA